MTEGAGSPGLHAWGRIDADGTVWLRTADGERQIGSWQAGSAAEGLAYYARKYADLAADVTLLEARLAGGRADPRTVATAATKLRATLAEANVLGDVAALDARLDAVLAQTAAHAAARAQERAAAAEAAADRKRALVSEAQQLAASTDWKAAGDRFRAIVEEWKAIRGVSRTADSALWEQLAAARREFDQRRRAHFAELGQQRQAAAERKERLAAEAEKLAESTEWVATATRFRELMAAWKAAGRADRPVDDALWARFKAAQDSFFAARGAALAARDSEFLDNQRAKEALLAEAEALDPARDLEGARKRLRTIHDRWERIGKVPRDAMRPLEDRLAAVEQRVREAGSEARHVTPTESPLVIRLRESVQKLQARLARAEASGDTRLAEETAEALRTQQEWLAQAERSN